MPPPPRPCVATYQRFWNATDHAWYIFLILGLFISLGPAIEFLTPRFVLWPIGALEKKKVRTFGESTDKESKTLRQLT